MSVVSYRGKNYVAPDGWHECSPLLWGCLVPFSRLPAEQITEDIKMLAAQLWLQVPDKAWRKWRLGPVEWAMLCQQFEWIWTPPTVRPFAEFKHEGILYHVFDEDFSDSSALETSMGLMEYMAFTHPDEPDVSAFERILATFCRPTRPDLARFRDSDDWNGDVRKPYNEIEAGYRAAALVRLPEPLRLALFDYFERSAKAFLHQYDRIFGGDPSEEPRYPDGRGWLMLLKNVAKDGHFGNFDQVGRQPAHLVWAAMLDDVLIQEEIANQQEETSYE
ncbi:hypothetical protein [Persicitalea jodogahamensis]|uniref:Uncharacterized protein n=1 Tax=Persicitalea jodogahamensis TaxID=402147 RepID=A0A8J3D3B8_9BACT|nr:hypothetical protein [Persicitalea jodogahamensis]GHB64206.1 hypothetical protein GCM10007390_17610 [Persicitalea jodogahamensis]